MKTLCVAALVLSLSSVCQPAPLACEKLLQPVDKAPDLTTGNWRVIAMSSEICLWSLLMRHVFWPSVEVDITSTETPNTFIDNYKGKMFGVCYNESGDGFVYRNSKSTGKCRPDDEPMVLLQSGCPDCVVLKQDHPFAAHVLLFSRRKTISAEEMKEFETQAECLGWSKPQLFNSDHDYTNCKSEDEINRDDIFSVFIARLSNVNLDVFKCVRELFLKYLPDVSFCLFYLNAMAYISGSLPVNECPP
ncbi:Saxitoxin and tetrodotoxin-binding protein 1 [Dissostichus eleginoides]|uniref:Saxitoxin and tetrodotoxin-binding protein 1 n=1 Tax=Dissostichus eleginoides TaxID=100907 RepID=A0AAD9FC66_DISEL|nr:Saxitoxin and tetrodotoxin-binding protein 1 [Dissostichus eleginoides]